MKHTKLSFGMVASLQSPPPFSPGKIIVPRIAIGEVVFEQPPGSGIGTVSVGSPCGHGGHGHSCPGREKDALDSARGVPRAKAPRADWLGYDQILHERVGLDVAVSTIHSFIKVRAKHRKQVQYELPPLEPQSSVTARMNPENIASRIAALKAKPVEHKAKPKHFHFEESEPLKLVNQSE